MRQLTPDHAARKGRAGTTPALGSSVAPSNTSSCRAGAVRAGAQQGKTDEQNCTKENLKLGF